MFGSLLFYLVVFDATIAEPPPIPGDTPRETSVVAARKHKRPEKPEKPEKKMPAAPAGEDIADSPPNVIAPISSEGYLWPPTLGAVPHDQVAIRLGLTNHKMRIVGDVDAWVFGFTVAGEYTLLDRLTLGAAVPFIQAYAISGIASDSGVDFGNIRFHVRYMLDDIAALQALRDLNIVLTPAFRLRLPTNTFLTVNNVPFFGDWELIEPLMALEPMLIAGWAHPLLSVTVATGPSYFIAFNRPDFGFWSLIATAGTAPLPPLPELEFLLELSLLVELTEANAPQENTQSGRAVPFTLSIGSRYRYQEWSAELALRFGLHKGDFYYGDVNMGIQIGRDL